MPQKMAIEQIDITLSELRLTRPSQIKSMQDSLARLGQLHPVVVRKTESGYQLLDGFKRYYASQDLGWIDLEAQVVEGDEVEAKIMILSYNQQGTTLVDYEQAQIVYSLHKEHLVPQKQIASMLHYSQSWVSRRIMLIERLDQTVKSHLQLGKITPSHVRELVRLPRGKQEEFVKVIIDHNLTSRQTSRLVSMYLGARTSEEQVYQLHHPLEVLNQQVEQAEINDCRLSLQANRVLSTTRHLIRQQHIFIGQSTDPPLSELEEMELAILTDPFTRLLKKLRMIESILKIYEKQ
jgi:ParB/RepB/Spo0J family partition protein